MKQETTSCGCSHTHDHEHSHDHISHESHSHGLGGCKGHHHSTSNIKLAFLLNFSFAIIEVIGGLLTNSTAIISDALHDFGDSISLATSLIFERISKKEPTRKYNYGLKRLALIGAFINIAVLTGGTAFVLYSAVNALFNPEVVKAEGMLILAFLGIAVNGISVLRMKGAKNVLDRSVVMHLMEDLMGWVAVLVGGIIIFFTDLYIVDTILTFIITAINIRNIWNNLKTTFSVVMQANPDIKLSEQIKENLSNLSGVKEIISSEMWTLDGESHVFTAKIMIEDKKNNDVLENAKSVLSHYGIENSTIELVAN